MVTKNNGGRSITAAPPTEPYTYHCLSSPVISSSHPGRLNKDQRSSPRQIQRRSAPPSNNPSRLLKDGSEYNNQSDISYDDDSYLLRLRLTLEHVLSLRGRLVHATGQFSLSWDCGTNASL